MTESKHDGDWILRRLIGMVNRLPDAIRIEVPITLTVQGQVKIAKDWNARQNEDHR